MSDEDLNAEIANQTLGPYIASWRKKKPVYRTCDMCGGTGRISKVNDIGWGNSSITIGTCPECHGKGEIDTGMYVYE